MENIQTAWEQIVTEIDAYKEKIKDKPLGYKLAALTTLDEVMNILVRCLGDGKRDSD